MSLHRNCQNHTYDLNVIQFLYMPKKVQNMLSEKDEISRVCGNLCDQMHGRFLDIIALPSLQRRLVRLDSADRHDVLVRRVCRDTVLRGPSAVQAVSPVGDRSYLADRLVSESYLGDGSTAEILQRVQPSGEVSTLRCRGSSLCEVAR